MLAARKLNEVLRTGISDGIQGLCLMTVEGSIVVSAFSDEHLAMRRDARNEDLPDEVALTAIASTIWTQYTSGKKRMLIILMDKLDYVLLCYFSSPNFTACFNHPTIE